MKTDFLLYSYPLKHFKSLYILAIIFISLLLARCNNATIKKPILLYASREAPLGWVYLTIYKDSSFEFTSTGLRANLTKNYRGKAVIRNDSLFLNYTDSIPKAGTKAVFNETAVAFLNGEYPERLSISITKLQHKK